MVLKAVTIAEIERIFEILDRLQISREEVVIPLRPGAGGSVTRRSDGKLEIVVDKDADFDTWLGWLERELMTKTRSFG